jgi:uncharacterized protein YyaL (SSP411 family)
MTSMTSGPVRSAATNRLIQETSPYLLQHAHNPVDWYPWGREAFEAARAQDKPIFLSVGYSTCYWCHVMERQCFENPSIAALMNQHFINVKVDREERPDVDQLYMTAVQVLTQQGGWPMSVFLDPKLRPFEGGTYFPPEDSHGRPGFASVLRAVADAWGNRRAAIDQRATRLTEVLQELSRPRLSEAAVTLDGRWLETMIGRCWADYDAEHGGFGAAPKFPRQTLLELLLATWPSDPPSAIPNQPSRVLHSLVAMAVGGIRDQLGGGFHRYSTDARWLVPHFEIMLYDNAMLAWLYAEAYRRVGQEQFARIARGAIDFVLREMTSPQGAFYTALDAEVDGREGEPYLWTGEQIDRVLGASDAAIFGRAYGLDGGPNFADPHQGDGAPRANVLYLPRTLAETAQSLGMTRAQLDSRLGPMRRKLLEARKLRKQPARDEKIITGWNALMVRALAHSAQALDEPAYATAATAAAGFLLDRHVAPDGGLWRTSRDGQARHRGILDDYACLAQSLLALHRATSDARWLEEARRIVAQMRLRFEDRDEGGFFLTEAGADDLIVRQKVLTDSPLPSGNAVAAMVLLELDEVEPARRTLQALAGAMDRIGEGASALVQAAAIYIQRHGPLPVGPAALPSEQAILPTPAVAGPAAACTDKGCAPPGR